MLKIFSLCSPQFPIVNMAFLCLGLCRLHGGPSEWHHRMQSSLPQIFYFKTFKFNTPHATNTHLPSTTQALLSGARCSPRPCLNTSSKAHSAHSPEINCPQVILLLLFKPKPAIMEVHHESNLTTAQGARAARRRQLTVRKKPLDLPQWRPPSPFAALIIEAQPVI